MPPSCYSAHISLCNQLTLYTSCSHGNLVGSYGKVLIFNLQISAETLQTDMMFSVI